MSEIYVSHPVAVTRRLPFAVCLTKVRYDLEEFALINYTRETPRCRESCFIIACVVTLRPLCNEARYIVDDK